MYVAPNFFEFISGRRILYRYTAEKQIPTKLARILKVILVSFLIVLFSVMFTDKYSRVEFYDCGGIIECDRHNQVVNEYDESDIEFIELRTDYSPGRHVTYWTEAVIHLKDKSFILKTGYYVTHDNDGINYETVRSLYGLRRIIENFPDKIKINTENMDTLLEVEHYDYTREQVKELCDIFEVDYEEMMLWLEEEWDIVLKSEKDK